MAKQLFINNFEQLLVGPVKDAPTTGTPATELDYGILRLSNGASGTLLDPGANYYILTLLKRAGSSETNIEIVRVTDVDNSTPGECRITVNRAQEGTTAKAFIAGDYATLRFTKASAENLLQPDDLLVHSGSTSNPHSVTKAQVGLGSVDNTADTAKPVSTAQQTALNLKANIASPTFTGTVGGITAAMVGAPSGSGTSTGTNTGDNAVNTLYSGLVTNATHTGDVTGATALTITANAVTNAKAAQMAVNTIKGRITAGTGNAEDLTAANVRTILNVADGANNYVHITNANLTGEVTSVGNATTVTNAAVIGKVLTGYVSGAGTVAATDTILQAINKLNGNVALKGVGDVTLVGVQTLTNKTLTGYTETVYTLAGTVIDVANGTVQTKTLAANTTFTESLADGQSVMLGITAGAYSVTWPTTVWAKVGGSGVAPTLTSTGVNWVILWQTGGTLRGSFLGTT